MRYYDKTLSYTRAKAGQRNAEIKDDFVDEFIDETIVSFCDRF